MKKRFAAIFLTFIIFIGMEAQALNGATTFGVGSGLDLTFDGTTATCTFTVLETGSNIKVTMTLWQGNTIIETWTKEASSIVRMNEQCTVSKGKTYTLEVSYTVNGSPKPGQSITKTNS